MYYDFLDFGRIYEFKGNACMNVTVVGINCHEICNNMCSIDNMPSYDWLSPGELSNILTLILIQLNYELRHVNDTNNVITHNLSLHTYILDQNSVILSDDSKYLTYFSAFMLLAFIVIAFHLISSVVHLLHGSDKRFNSYPTLQDKPSKTKQFLFRPDLVNSAASKQSIFALLDWTGLFNTKYNLNFRSTAVLLVSFIIYIYFVFWYSSQCSSHYLNQQSL